jgi:hypothetical protein
MVINDWEIARSARSWGNSGLAEPCMAEDLIDTVRETIKFLRKATAEMRQIADEGDPETAQQLRHMANQCEAEASELSERFGFGP